MNESSTELTSKEMVDTLKTWLINECCTKQVLYATLYNIVVSLPTGYVVKFLSDGVMWCTLGSYVDISITFNIVWSCVRDVVLVPEICRVRRRPIIEQYRFEVRLHELR